MLRDYFNGSSYSYNGFLHYAVFYAGVIPRSPFYHGLLWIWQSRKYSVWLLFVPYRYLLPYIQGNIWKSAWPISTAFQRTPSSRSFGFLYSLPILRCWSKQKPTASLMKRSIQDRIGTDTRQIWMNWSDVSACSFMRLFWKVFWIIFLKVGIIFNFIESQKLNLYGIYDWHANLKKCWWLVVAILLNYTL